MFIRVALNELSPLTVVAARVGLGTAGLAIYAVATRSPGLAPRALARRWRGYLLLAFFSAVFPYGLITLGQTVIPSGSAAILNATSPLFSAGLALVVARGAAEEVLSPARAGGLLLGVAGVALLVLRPAEAPSMQASFFEQSLGHLAVVTASACYAVAALFIRLRMPGETPAAISLGQTALAALILVPAALVWSPPSAWPGPAALGSLFMLGVINTSVAYLIYYRLVQRAGATRALSVTYLQPAVALVYGALLLAEPVTLPQLGGLAAILSGVALATRR